MNRLRATDVGNQDDCDDTDDRIYLGATEYCDFADNDCDGLAEFDQTNLYGTVIGFHDPDGDGYSSWPGYAGASCSVGRTVLGDDLVALLGDCDDSNADIAPDMIEILGDSVDNDCDGNVD